MVDLSNIPFRTDFEGEGSAYSVQLVWDWRLARVYHADGSIVDECIWDGSRTTSSLVNRLALLMDDRMTTEARTLAERFPDATMASPTTVNSWPELNSQETNLLQDASLRLAERSVADAASNPDIRLEHLVRATEEIRATHNTLESRLVEWVGIFLPSLDLDQNRNTIAKAVAKSSDLLRVSERLEVTVAEIEMGDKEGSSIHSLATTVANLATDIENMEDSVREVASTHLPSLSLLLGPLLAAKLCTTAHGRARLARLPAGTIQVLGAEKALFLHLRQGTDPPKHGHIFQHSWICRSPKWTRGPIARMLAAKAAIAVRSDHFGGDPWTSKQVAKVEQKVGEIRARRSRK